MLIDWTHWLSSLRVDQLLWLLSPLLMLDAPRYAVGSVVMCLWDFVAGVVGWSTRSKSDPGYARCPSVCVVVAGINEAATLGATLASAWGSYPRMEMIVVDDGSTDAMADVAAQFARQHAGVRVIRRRKRGGKSSALNCALPFTQAEILVCVDSDSHLGPQAIWEIVQPFSSPDVGAVAGTVEARNPTHSLATWLQAVEYRRCIFVGRLLSSRLGLLGIVSGALGAYRRSALQRLGGWDVGPGEDGDLALRLRKAGFTIEFAQRARCLTNLPISWWRLLKQRRRWEWAVVTFECRKHIDLANPLSPNFRLSNLCLILDRWLYSIVLQYAFWGYLVWLMWHRHENTKFQFLLFYLGYLFLELLQLGVVLYYSENRRKDLMLGIAAPLMPLYYLILRLVTTWAITEELLVRRSFRDNFVPKQVRDATWHW